jgi:GH25 family lysozyme M1 (1,4-beta-N-acetylmuramidase)
MFQGDPPFDRIVAEQGVEWSISKATEGHGYIDPKWTANCARTPLYMRAVGAYHVLRAGDAKGQADHHARQWELLAKTAAGSGAHVIPPVLDFEITDKQPAEQLIDNAVAWVIRSEALTGVYPWLYSYPSFLREQCKNLAPLELRKCPMWLAWYPGFGHGVASTVDPIAALDRAKALPTLWRTGRWAAWQYDGDKGERLPNGVDADFNVACGTVEEMLGIAPPEPSNGPDTLPQTPTSKSSQSQLRAVKWSDEKPYEQPSAADFVAGLFPNKDGE